MNPTPSQSEISCLVRLLGDRDASVRQQVRAKLLEWGEKALPFLEMAAREENPRIRPHALELLQALHPQGLREKFRRLSGEGSGGVFPLEKGVMLLTEFGYPDFYADRVRTALDQLAGELGARILPHDSAAQVVEKLTVFLFVEKGFSGNVDNYLDPDNTYFNKVLENKTGIPISLSVLGLFVASRLDLPVFGVGMPGHFLLKFISPEGTIFFDPFHRGQILTRDDCAKIANRFGFRFEKRFLDTTPNREILLRMIHNLILFFKRTGQKSRAVELTEYAKILTHPHRTGPSESPENRP